MLPSFSKRLRASPAFHSNELRYPGPSNLGFLCRAVSENCLRVPIWVVQDLADGFTVVGDDVNDVEADWLSVVVPADA